MLALVLLALVACSLVYCVLTVIAAGHYGAALAPEAESRPPISVLKPLAGVDLDLEQNLRTFFEQKYPEYELLFAVRSADDPAVAVVDHLRSAFPGVPSSLIVTGEPPYPNAKVFSLHCMFAAARYDLLVMADSDVHVTPTFLSTLAAEFRDSKTGLLVQHDGPFVRRTNLQKPLRFFASQFRLEQRARYPPPALRRVDRQIEDLAFSRRSLARHQETHDVRIGRHQTLICEITGRIPLRRLG